MQTHVRDPSLEASQDIRIDLGPKQLNVRAFLSDNAPLIINPPHPPKHNRGRSPYSRPGS